MTKRSPLPNTVWPVNGLELLLVSMGVLIGHYLESNQQTCAHFVVTTS